MSLYTTADQTAIAANIRRIRTEKNLTLTDLSERTGFYTHQLERMERGEWLTPFTVAEVARWMGVSYDTLTTEYTAPVVAPATDLISRLERCVAQIEAR